MKAAWTIVGSIFALCLVAQPGWSGQVQTSILQYREDRLYFPVGEESRIYQYSDFEIRDGDSTIYSGLIEHSWIGVAVSEPTGGFFGSLDPATLDAVLTTAEIDSLAAVVIGTDLTAPFHPPDSLLPSRVELRFYSDSALMWDDFAGRTLDGVITLRKNGGFPGEGVTLSSPCPEIATLVPNVGKSCNLQGQLTTSLFYRFDPARLDLVWNGDARPALGGGPAPFNRLWVHRSYTFDPPNGHSLFALVKDLPAVIRLYYAAPVLRPTALFFADVLAQEHCRVELTEERRNADLYVEFVVASALIPALSVHALEYELSGDTVAESAAAEYVAQIGRHLSFLATATDEDDYYRTVEQVERKMTEDLGVFPLFYPVYYFHCNRGLEGVRLDADGQLDFSEVCKVILPKPPGESP